MNFNAMFLSKKNHFSKYCIDDAYSIKKNTAYALTLAFIDIGTPRGNAVVIATSTQQHATQNALK